MLSQRHDYEDEEMNTISEQVDKFLETHETYTLIELISMCIRRKEQK